MASEYSSAIAISLTSRPRMELQSLEEARSFRIDPAREATEDDANCGC